tara:strand:- start:864 stop:1091 length:228 start_codon:yes stop_codon:yes gene_type:complete
LYNIKFQNISNQFGFTTVNNEFYYFKIGVGFIFFGLILYYLKEVIVGFFSAISILIGSWLIVKGIKLVLNKNNRQ